MKQYCLCLTIVLMLTYGEPSLAQETIVTDVQVKKQVIDTVSPLLQALKDGDVQTIRQYMSDDLYSNYKVLFEQNKEYPEFLRNFYKGASFQTGKITRVGDHILVDTIIKFPDSNTSVTRVLLKKDKNNTMKIFSIREKKKQ